MSDQFTVFTSRVVPIPAENVVNGYRRNVGVLKDPTGTEADKAVARCRVCRQIGGIHQKLHTT